MAVGKNFLENLTVAMYDNPLTVYREFIQNAADSIDKAVVSGLMEKKDALIDIHIEKNKRNISVYDNAMGISMREFKKIMKDVADSEKDRNKEKGFRGIGRLAGLGYCDTLVFKTSFKGEDKEAIITWNGAKLKEIVSDTMQHPTSDQLIDMITDIQYIDAEIEDHYFEVIMRDVTFESDDLLDQNLVIDYLENVAPVPYANFFIFSPKIHEFAKNNGFKIDEYNISVNANAIVKPYKTRLYEGTDNRLRTYDEIHEIDFKIFTNSHGKKIAWLWYGIAKFEKCIPNINKMRCIRLRKENIQIGNEETLGSNKGYFREPRGNGYFIGELFVVDNNLIPNARRDYFNSTPDLKTFEKIVHEFFYSELYELYHYASKVRSAQKSLVNCKEKEKKFEEKIKYKGFIDKEDEESAKKEIEDNSNKVAKAKRELENRRKDADKNEIYDLVFKEIEKTYGVNENDTLKIDKKLIDAGKNNKYLTQHLTKYNKREQKLIARIYTIINDMLPKNMAEIVIQKIQEELRK